MSDVNNDIMSSASAPSDLREKLLPDNNQDGRSTGIDLEGSGAVGLSPPPAATATATATAMAATTNDDINTNDSGTWSRGERQPSKFRDIPFALLFWIHLAVVLFFAFAWGVPALDSLNDGMDNNDYDENDDNNDDKKSLYGFLYLCQCSGVASLAISVFALYVLTLPRLSERLIEIGLVFSISMSMLNCIIYAYLGVGVLSVLFLVLFVWGIVYAICVWRRIPFAAANLSTAVSAIRANWGVFFVATAIVLLVVLWSLFWTLSYLGVYAHTLNCTTDEEGNEQCTSKANDFAILFLLSFYWTNEVLKNIVQVTVAGVVGTWWFDPTEASSCCSNSVRDSFVRSVTYSFGSICFGSLLVAIIQVLKHLIHMLRRERHRHDGLGFLLCILECIVACLKDIVEYFNQWAYIYVGLYGYDYTTAGKNVIRLFRHRGWTAIINDSLVNRTLLMVSIVLGGLTGCFGLFLGVLKPSWIQSFEDSATFISFFVPFLIGFAISLVLMSVIASAVQAVVVCFAEAPQEFENNYPELSQKMISAWTKIYPNEFSYTPIHNTPVIRVTSPMVVEQEHTTI